MTLNQLEYFCAVCRYHSITRAAESLFVWECKIVCVNRYCMNLLYAPYWGKQR